MKVKRILSLILSLTLMLTGILSVSLAESAEPEGGLESDTSLSVIMEDEAEIEFVADEPEDEPLRTAASDNDEEDPADIDAEEDEDIDDGEDEDIPDIEDDEEDFDEPEEDEPEKPEEEPSEEPVTSLDDPEDLIVVPTGITVSEEDHIITLITCDRSYGGVQGRLLVMGVELREE